MLNLLIIIVPLVYSLENVDQHINFKYMLLKIINFLFFVGS